MRTERSCVWLTIMHAQPTRQKPDVHQLLRMNVASLRRLHDELFERDRSISNPVLLRRKLAWHLQAEEQGGLPQAAMQRALAIARDVDLRIHAATVTKRARKVGTSAISSTILPAQDSRLPMPGSLLVKAFKGRTLVVKVLEEGFEYDGRRYTSLSAIARDITGTKWNGYAFFSLTKEAAHGRR